MQNMKQLSCKAAAEHESGAKPEKNQNPQLVGVKQFPIKEGRYVVLLFKATEYSGTIVSSDEGQMEWVESNRLSEINTVDDFDDLMRIINDPTLTEFQYLVYGDTWTVSIK